jgi:D-tyrosyl-tRNA(Tyr) deacylase
MRALIQRVSKASVTVNNQTISSIGNGLVVLLGIGHADREEQAQWLAEKIATLRIFEDDAGKMNLSVLDVKGSALVVSQFTLYADAQKGRRPSFTDAAPPEEAEPLIHYFAQKLESFGVPVKSGVFRAEMLVEIHNDGPVTIWLER